jgi:hypothetical protein
LSIWSYALIGLVGGNNLDPGYDINRNSVLERWVLHGVLGYFIRKIDKDELEEYRHGL